MLFLFGAKSNADEAVGVDTLQSELDASAPLATICESCDVGSVGNSEVCTVSVGKK